MHGEETVQQSWPVLRVGEHERQDVPPRETLAPRQRRHAQARAVRALRIKPFDNAAAAPADSAGAAGSAAGAGTSALLVTMLVVVTVHAQVLQVLRRRSR